MRANDSSQPSATLGVLGAGAWGTALALVAARAGNRVLLWAREEDVSAAIRTRRENTLFLPGVPLPEGIEAGNDLACLDAAKAILVVAPAQHVRACLVGLTAHVPASVPLVLCAKGIERGTLKLMSEVAREAAPGHPLAVLSGPSFAADVAAGRPTAVTLACPSAELGQTLLKMIGLPTFRPYWSDDVIGAEVGGAVKNVLAIACGIVEGKAFGDSARAALITRGFAEMRRFAAAIGGKVETLHGLSGLGDLVLTCSSPRSRNMSVGMALGRGERLEDVLKGRMSVAEGVETAPALAAKAETLGIEMPIVRAVNDILSGRMDADAAILALLARPFRSETD